MARLRLATSKAAFGEELELPGGISVPTSLAMGATLMAIGIAADMPDASALGEGAIIASAFRYGYDFGLSRPRATT